MINYVFFWLAWLSYGPKNTLEAVTLAKKIYPLLTAYPTHEQNVQEGEEGGRSCQPGGRNCQPGGRSCQPGGRSCQLGGRSCQAGVRSCQPGGRSCQPGGRTCQPAETDVITASSNLHSCQERTQVLLPKVGILSSGLLLSSCSLKGSTWRQNFF